MTRWWLLLAASLAGCTDAAPFEDLDFRVDIGPEASNICDASIFEYLGAACVWSTICGQRRGSGPDTSGASDGSGVAGSDSLSLHIGGPWGFRRYLPRPTLGYERSQSGVFWRIDNIPHVSCSSDAMNDALEDIETDIVVYWAARMAPGETNRPTIFAADPGERLPWTGSSFVGEEGHELILDWYPYEGTVGPVDSFWFGGVLDSMMRSETAAALSMPASWVSTVPHEVSGDTSIPDGETHQIFSWSPTDLGCTGCRRVNHYLYGGAIGLRYNGSGSTTTDG